MTRDPLTSRYSVCIVGNGYSVEDRKTGERMSYHTTRGSADREAQHLGNVARAAWTTVEESRRPPCAGPRIQMGARMMRVQIPAYTDRWMMGDRYGEIVKIGKGRKGGRSCDIEIAHVKLDISGKTVKVVLNDCTEVA